MHTACLGLAAQIAEPRSVCMPTRARRRRQRLKSSPSASAPTVRSLAHASDPVSRWDASRLPESHQGNTSLPPGTRRKFSLRNVLLAFKIIYFSTPELFLVCWGPDLRSACLLFAMNVVRGMIPASRCYSHAVILDEVCRNMASRRCRRLNIVLDTVLDRDSRGEPSTACTSPWCGTCPYGIRTFL